MASSSRDDRPLRALLDRIRADAPVTRRDYLRILVTVSGGLVVGTAAVAAGVFRRHGLGTAPPLRVAGALPRGQAVGFNYPTANDPAMAIRLDDDRLVGYSTVCTHLSCAVLWRPDRGRLECPCHDGVFDPATGEVVAGPPPRPLPKVILQERDGAIWAVGTEP
jgi:nitrite reductase/ring-hydroxylating ferredoxin subunit